MRPDILGYADDFLLKYLEAEKHVSPCTVRNYRNDLVGNLKHGSAKGFFQFLDSRGVSSLEAVDRNFMRQYLADLIKQGVAKASLARRMSVIRSFYRYLLREGIIQHNPIELVVSPRQERRLPNFLTPSEISRLLDMSDTSTPHGIRDRAIMELFYAGGLRISELSELDTGQLELDQRQLRITGKGNKERVVIIGQPAALALDAYLKYVRPRFASQDSKDAVFLNRRGGRLTGRWIQMQMLNYASTAGLPKKVHPHMLRHTFATHLLDGGADLRVVQDLLGHSNLATTQIYTHVTHNQARRVYMASHPFAKEEKDIGDDTSSTQEAANRAV
ncbi:MAG: tyrosine recombinase XerC [Dehalococcoidia bacterium]|nr:tyrosine recombinase XerC [Dehalococcoidia bacterium]